jgi:hypothetical protein
VGAVRFLVFEWPSRILQNKTPLQNFFSHLGNALPSWAGFMGKPTIFSYSA